MFLPVVALLQTVQQRGAAVIKARKLSSAMSAAKAICDHMRDIWSGTPEVNAVFIYFVFAMWDYLATIENYTCITLLLWHYEGDNE